ncbi:hypothetical protein WL29_20505 [Burkholderia ubonensis]|uniref:Uncharacterized protein n=1 Tax=Burkholderia ubonensis TaxID=101571 RepID=A0A106QB43_9BURK|nr:hypothetical protein [Burkholderia ubonensis]KWA83749.1 hypothetical protein WL29_20505 [Burkholderia ubonensis]
MTGIVLALEGHAWPYVVLGEHWTYPVGLTQPGDQVALCARPWKDFYTVELGTFSNPSLERAMPNLAQLAAR